MDQPTARQPSSASRLYDLVREMAIAYQFSPGERINEVLLSRQLTTSRTPLREALNRLVAEGFLTFKPDRGFYCRELNPRNIFELYQFRTLIESSAARIACEQCTNAEIDSLSNFVKDLDISSRTCSIEHAVKLDEEFHERLVALARNQEMSNTLLNINARIRFIRWIDMENKVGRTQGDYAEIVSAMHERNPDKSVALITSHIERRIDEIFKAVRQGKERLSALQKPDTKTTRQ